MSALLMYPLGDLSLRLVSAAWRYCGGEVSGFTHGNLLGQFDPGFALVEASAVNQYVVNSHGEQEAAQYFLKKYPFSIAGAAVSWMPNNTYKNLFKAAAKKEEATDVRTIMLVGFPMDPSNRINKWYPEQHALAHLWLELLLIKLLRQKDYKIIYKAHPDRQDNIKDIFRCYVDVIEFGRLEDVYEMADCLVFGHSNTTTFGFSLFTAKPIVLIDIKGKEWYPRFFKLLQKRCCVVSATVDKEGRIIFDQQEFYAAIQHAPQTLSYDVIEEFAL